MREANIRNVKASIGEAALVIAPLDSSFRGLDVHLISFLREAAQLGCAQGVPTKGRGQRNWLPGSRASYRTAKQPGFLNARYPCSTAQCTGGRHGRQGNMKYLPHAVSVLRSHAALLAGGTVPINELWAGPASGTEVCTKAAAYLLVAICPLMARFWTDTAPCASTPIFHWVLTAASFREPFQVTVLESSS